MRTVFPEYYTRFRCLANRCRHTCCAGWEIDIDPETRERYRRAPGALGKRLAASIDDAEDPARFRLAADERCPFLNREDLCDLILAGGDDLLCQICRDHPRFRTFLSDRTELGVGLCCEASAEVILSAPGPFRLLSEGDETSPTGDEAALLALRDRLFAVAQDTSLPLEARMDRILALCGAALPERRIADWAEFYLGLERMDEAWTTLLHALRERGDSVDIISYRTFLGAQIAEYERLLVYFLYRHFLKALDDGDITGKAAFAVLSVRLLFTLGAVCFEARGGQTPDDRAELARLYSAEIEYSEDNMDALFDALWCGDGEA